MRLARTRAAQIRANASHARLVRRLNSSRHFDAGPAVTNWPANAFGTGDITERKPNRGREDANDDLAHRYLA